MASLILPFVSAAILLVLSYIIHYTVILPRNNPLRQLPGPPVRRWFGSHMGAVLDPAVSPKFQEVFTKAYGRNIRIRGVVPWEERLLTYDPVSLSYILKNSATIYEKPWQSRKLITTYLGCGLLSAEGLVHKRQRRVATPAFSIQNMKALEPLMFEKGVQLKDRWAAMIHDDMDDKNKKDSATIDVCHWLSRAAFDVVGLSGFDWNFNSIQDESNELFRAYRDMFEVAISQASLIRSMVTIYVPFIWKIFPDKTTQLVDKCQKTIHRIAGQIVQDKKRKIMDGEKSGYAYDGKDLISLFLKSNSATDLQPGQRISDEDIISNINTVMFAGSDTTSLSLTWTLLYLAQYPHIQTRLREELLSAAPPASVPDDPTHEEIHSLYETLSSLPYLDNVMRESLRLVPPIHSSIRVATRDDMIPTMYPVRNARDGTYSNTVHVQKGTVVHVPIEAFNLDKTVWGEDAWEFNPDRWDNLPELALSQPGLFSNMLTFSGGPRSCIGLRFSMIEMKTFLYILLTNFRFAETEEKILKANVVFTRPYVVGKFREGSQCPLVVSRYVGGDD